MKELLLYILILFFIFLILYQIFLAQFKKPIVEGNTGYKDYNTSDPKNVMILAQQNAGNISVLRSQLGDANKLKSIIEDISGNVSSLQTQVDGLVLAQQQAGTDAAGGNTEPIAVSGTE